MRSFKMCLVQATITQTISISIIYLTICRRGSKNVSMNRKTIMTKNCNKILTISFSAYFNQNMIIGQPSATFAC